MTRVAFDSNIVIYAAGGERVPADLPKIDRSQQLVFALAKSARLIAPVQALGEALRILSIKLNKSEASVAAAVTSWEDLFEIPATTFPTLKTGAVLAREHRLQYWDAVIVASAAAAGCQLLLSEDMQHGFAWRGLTIVNPFADPPHPLLAALL